VLPSLLLSASAISLVASILVLVHVAARPSPAERHTRSPRRVAAALGRPLAALAAGLHLAGACVIAASTSKACVWVSGHRAGETSMDFLPAAEDACAPLLPNFWVGLVLSAAAATAAMVLSLAASPRAATTVEAAAEHKSRKACNRLLVHLSAALSVLFSLGMVVLGGLALARLADGFWLCDKVSWFVAAALLLVFPTLSAAGAALSRTTDPRLLAGRKDHPSAPPPVITADYILKTRRPAPRACSPCEGARRLFTHASPL